MAVLWTAFIFYALTQEPSGLPKFKWLAFPGVDKVIHFVIFAIDAVLIQLTVESRKRTNTLVFTIGFCVLFGGTLELVQHYFVEGRNGDAIDWLADALGTLVGVVLIQNQKKF